MGVSVASSGSPRSPLSSSSRIAVVGAGAAGLTVARELARRGCRRVTVFEREVRVGGKCCTFFHDGRSYELGAVVATPAYTRVTALLRELGIAKSASLDSAFVDLASPQPSRFPPLVRHAGWGRLATSCARLGVESVRHRALREPGLRHLPGESFVPFGEWSREHGVADAAHLIVEPLFTPLGYGYLDESPTAYVLKHLTVISAPFFEMLDRGYQGVWETVAGGLDVRLGAPIVRIRRGDEVIVETRRGAEPFDAVVLSAPLDEAVRYLDASDEESDLASRIAYYDYRVVAARVTGLPDRRYIYFPDHFASESRGAPMLGYKRWKDRDVFLFYAYGDEGRSLDDTIGRLHTAVQRFGGTVTGVLEARAWRYFPHVSCDDLARGFHDRLEALQGLQRTYYAGELLAFGTVETVVAHATDLVARHFEAA